MSYKNLVIPFLKEDLILASAESFRQDFCGKNIPVDIEGVIERELKISIVPIPNLRKFCNSDAHITSNWKSIYIDNDYYLDERYDARIRFSLAHEVGHLILHKKIYNEFQIKDIEDLIRFIGEIPGDQYGRLEAQANLFAGHLLIPQSVLIKERVKVLEKYKTKLTKITDGVDLNPYLAAPLSEVFGVSEQAVEIALSKI